MDVDAVKNTKHLSALLKGYNLSEQSAIDFAHGIKNGSIQLKDGETMLAGYQTYLKATGRESELAAIKTETLSSSMKVLSSIGWMVAITAVTTLVSKGIEKLSDYANATQIASDKAEAFASSVSSATKDFASNSASLSDLNSEYQSLSQGVNALGENVSLSADQYDRYKEIIEQVHDIMPELSTYFNAQGEAIGFAKGQLNDLSAEYENYIQKQAKSFLVNGDADGNKIQDVLNSYDKNSSMGFWEDIKNTWNNMWGSYSVDDLPLGTMIQSFKELNTAANTSKEELQKFLNDINISPDGKILQTNKTRSKAIMSDWMKEQFNVDSILDMSDNDLNQIRQGISGQLEIFQNELDTQMEQIHTSLLQIAYSKDSYWQMGDDQQNNVATLISSIDSSVWEQLGKDTPVKMQSFMEEIIYAISTNKDGFADAWNGLFALDADAMSTGEYDAKAKAFMDAICNVLGITAEDGKHNFMISLGFDIDTDQAMIDGLKKKLAGETDGLTSGVTSAVGIALAKTQAKISGKWVDTLNTKDLGLTNSDEFEKALEKQKEKLHGAALSANDYEAALNAVKEAQYEQNGNNISISFTNALSQVQALSDGLSQLDKIYADVSNKGDFDWSSILNNENFEKTFGKMDKVYDNFIKQVSNAPDDISACQSAFDDLATSYIFNATDDSGAKILQNVTEASKDATINLLNQMGLENSKILVDTQLAAKEEALKLGIESLDLANISAIDSTYGHISALLDQGEACGVTATALYALIADQTIFSNQQLNTTQKIQELEKLAKAFGVTADSAISTANVAKAFTSADGYNLSQDDIDNAVLEVMSSSVEDKIAAKFGSISAKFGSSSATKSVTDNANKSPAETFNWIDTKLKSTSKETDKLGNAFSKAFGLDASKEKYQAYLSQIQNDINTNAQAAAIYQQKLDSIGLSYEWIARIQSGAFDISSITDDGLKTQISEYQSYYDKMQSCYETIESLQEKQNQAQKDFADDYIYWADREIKKWETLTSLRKTYVSIKETFGGTASASDLKNEEHNIAREITRLKEYNDEAFNLMKTTQYGSDAWQTYDDKIIENKESIISLTESLADLASELANLPLDKLDAYIEKNEKKNNIYSEKLNNATKASKRNSLIDSQMELVKKNDKKTSSTLKETKTNLSNSLTGIKTAKAFDKKYVNTAQRTSIDAYYKKIQGYTKSKKQIPPSIITELAGAGHSELAKACLNYNAALTANQTAKDTAAINDETYKTQLADLSKQKFDNIATEYERKQSQTTSKQNLLSSKMDNAVSKGYLTSEGWYSQLISYESANTSSLKKELSSLQKNLNSSLSSGQIKKYSDEWWEMTDTINSVTEAIQESKNAVQEYKNSLQQVEFDNFEYLQQQIARITSEADFYIDLMSNKELTDDGGLTNYGLTTVGLHVQNFDTYTAQAKKYAEKIQQINTKLANAPNNTTLIAQKQEYEDLQRQAITNAENEKKAIADLQKNGYDSLIDSLSDLISKYKDLIKNAKDAHDYQNTISEKSDNAASLRKQIAAYSSMTGNEEVSAKLQKLSDELKDAEKDIQETMYEKYISDTENALDDMLGSLEEFINDIANDIEKLVSEAISNAKNNTVTITNTLSDLSSTYGTTLSTAINSIWGDNKYYNPQAGINSIIKKVEELIHASDAQHDNVAYSSASEKYTDLSGYEKSANKASTKVSDAKSNVLDTKNDLIRINKGLEQAEKERTKALNKYGKSSKQYKKADEKYQSYKAKTNAAEKAHINAIEKLDTAESNLSSTNAELSSVKAKNKDIVSELLNSIANPISTSPANGSSLDKKVYELTGGILSAANKAQLAKLLGTSVSDDDLLSKLQYLGFATGGIAHMVKSSGEDGIALARNGEGFVMPEHVNAIQNLLDAVPDITSYMNLVAPDYAAFPIRSQTPNVDVSVGDVYLPNVTDPKEFAGEFVKVLKNDTTVKKALGTFVGTKLAGGNSLSIRKY